MLFRDIIHDPHKDIEDINLMKAFLALFIPSLRGNRKSNPAQIENMMPLVVVNEKMAVEQARDCDTNRETSHKISVYESPLEMNETIYYDNDQTGRKETAETPLSRWPHVKKALSSENQLLELLDVVHTGNISTTCEAITKTRSYSAVENFNISSFLLGHDFDIEIKHRLSSTRRGHEISDDSYTFHIAHRNRSFSEGELSEQPPLFDKTPFIEEFVNDLSGCLSSTRQPSTKSIGVRD
uniref:Rho-GAP domain-containing protein n=1 Tax=Rhabditophanes sp. KR3021 TaxID=114890 RepID=A0AC35TSM6_9BILA